MRAVLFAFLLVGSSGLVKLADGQRKAGGAGLPAATEDEASAERSDKRAGDGARAFAAVLLETDGGFRRRRGLVGQSCEG